jgi:hypothetical protein
MKDKFISLLVSSLCIKQCMVVQRKTSITKLQKFHHLTQKDLLVSRYKSVPNIIKNFLILYHISCCGSKTPNIINIVIFKDLCCGTFFRQSVHYNFIFHPALYFHADFNSLAVTKLNKQPQTTD